MKCGAKKADLFLLELVCSLFLFAVCATVCVGLLVHARSLSRESARLTQAVYIAQDAAERYRSGQTIYDYYYADGTPDAYQTGAARRSDGAPEYAVHLTETADGAEIAVSRCSGGEGPIYTLTAARPVEVNP